MQLLH